ncbi:MAG: CAP domain-containing protein [Desulfitobacteriaceae bacterium]
MFKRLLGMLFLVLVFLLLDNERIWISLKDLQQTQPIQQSLESNKIASMVKTNPKVIIDQLLPAKSKKLSSEDINKVEHLVLDLINQDRLKNGVSPVIWDETAAKTARQHVQEEADNGYISHWGMDGSKPQLRYTRGGGLDVVDENESVSLWLQGGFQGVSVTELEKIVGEHEAAMLNEKPPNDGHRKNILDVHHTGVGVAIAIGKYGVSMAQEFTNHYAVFNPVPLTALPGSKINLSGRIFPGFHITGIYAVWEQTPHSMSIGELMQTHSYSDPTFDNLHFFAKPDGERYYIAIGSNKIFANNVKTDHEGNFSLTVPLLNKQALDYISVEIAPNNNLNDKFYAGQFVIEHT